MNEEAIKIRINDATTIKRFLQITRSFTSDIDVITGRVCLDAKSVLGLYSIDLSQDIYVRIITDDVDEYKRFCNEMEVFR